MTDRERAKLLEKTVPANESEFIRILNKDKLNVESFFNYKAKMKIK